MNALLTRRNIIIVLVFLVLAIGGLAVISLFPKTSNPPPITSAPTNLEPRQTVIGQSVEGRNITAYNYGQGLTRLLFVGGIHGGYEWNSVLLAYQFMDYLKANPTVIPKNLIIIVIPSANPDGVYHVTGKEGRFTATDVSTDQQVLESGRFNAQKIDLNRNFDCKWKPKSAWRETVVSAGTKAFSEPETIALRDFILSQKPVSAIFWHSQANAVYASECEDGILSATLQLVDTYAQASGYQAIKSFDNYDITGDAEGWLASIGVPAITVELKTHTDTDWDKNLAGIKALFKYFGQ